MFLDEDFMFLNEYIFFQNIPRKASQFRVPNMESGIDFVDAENVNYYGSELHSAKRTNMKRL